MDGIKENAAVKIPEGGSIGDIYKDPAETTKTIIEYDIDNKVYRLSPERIDINTLFDYKKGIALVEGLTYNDVYDIVSKRHAMNLIKGVDYVDNPEKIPAVGRYRLPTHEFSLRFLPGGFNVDILKPETVITGTEAERNLSDFDLHPVSNINRDQLRYLGLRLYDLKNITCFENGKITIAFRQAIVEKIDPSMTDLRKEVLSSFLLKGYSDRLSDVVLLVGPGGIPFIIRYESATGDIP